ncbi:MAG: hypothetical protein GY816_22450 [Cytophagales bacterium]|nr:hypothetical protein [Cytophagales bacterium]
MRILSVVIFILGNYLLSAQLPLEFGLGLKSESYTLMGANVVNINDSIFFSNEESFKNPIHGTIRNDPGLIFFINYALHDKGKVKLVSSLFYNRQWGRVVMTRLADIPTVLSTNYFPGFAKYTIFLPLQMEVSPFEGWGIFSSVTPLKTLRIRVGAGPSFHWGSIASRIDGFGLNLSGNREDPLFYETYYQFEDKAHRGITLNYNWSVKSDLIKSFGLQVTGSGSFGSVTKPFRVFGEKHYVPIQRRGLALFVTYHTVFGKNK